MWLDLRKPSQFAQELKSILLLIIRNSHTQGLSRHSDTIARDKVCFYRRLFADPMKPCRTNSDPVGSLGCINRVACGPKLFHSMSALLMVWSGLLWPSVWPTVHTTLLPVSESIVNPPTHPPSAHPPPYLWHPWYFRLCSKYLKISLSIQ